MHLFRKFCIVHTGRKRAVSTNVWPGWRAEERKSVLTARLLIKNSFVDQVTCDCFTKVQGPEKGSAAANNNVTNVWVTVVNLKETRYRNAFFFFFCIPTPTSGAESIKRKLVAFFSLLLLSWILMRIFNSAGLHSWKHHNQRTTKLTQSSFSASPAGWKLQNSFFSRQQSQRCPSQLKCIHFHMLPIWTRWILGIKVHFKTGTGNKQNLITGVYVAMRNA